MHIHIGYEIRLHFPEPTVMFNVLHIYPNRYQMIKPEKLTVEPFTSYEMFTDCFGNCCTRLLAPGGLFTLKNNGIVLVKGDLDRMNLQAGQISLTELPQETLPFLYSSRYCEVDLFQDFAWEKFGHIEPGYARAQAICDWVYHHIEFGYNYANSTKTAWEVLKNGRGVCRDFTHLAITICRALGMPARYVTGYLGDIEVAINPDPMDFSAWFEVFLANEWYTFDPRHNQRRIGRIVIGYGRDAADVAIATIFGNHKLDHFSVCTKEINNDQLDVVCQQIYQNNLD